MDVGKGEHILIVEDDFEISSIIKEVLSKFNYECEIASDGEIAFHIYETNKGKFDLVISDLGLPKISGVELFEKFYRNNPNIKFIAMSGFGHKDVQDELHSKGVSAFLSKPFNLENLLKTIRTVLDR